VNPGGVIVMLARSEDGHGGDAFCREMTAPGGTDRLMEGILSRDRAHTTPDQWQAQIFIRVLQKARVVYVSDAPEELVRSLRMYPARTAAEAMELADKLIGRENAPVTVIPDGVGVIVR
jgi:nickel-dependent lactate racemase